MNRRYSLLVPAVLLTFIFLAVSWPANAESSPLAPVLSLVADTPIERSLSEGETDVLELSLDSGRFVDLLVEQMGIDIMFRLFDPAGTLLTEQDAVKRPNDSEEFRWITATQGVYRVEIRCRLCKPELGSYKASIIALREPLATDEIVVRADRALSEGRRLRDLGTAEALRQAIGQYEQAADLWKQAERIGDLADAQNTIGFLHRRLGEPHEALTQYQRSLDLWRLLDNVRGEAMTLVNMGTLFAELGRLGEARQANEKALQLQRRSGDRVGEALALSRLGDLWFDAGEVDRAHELYQQAMNLRQQTGDLGGQSSSLNSLAMLYWRTGELQKGIDLLLQSLDLKKALKDRAGEASILTNLAAFSFELGQLEGARRFLRQALAIHEESGDRFGQAEIYSRLAAVDRKLGDYKAATASLELSLAIQRELEKPRGEIAVLREMAEVARKQGNPEEAIRRLKEALALMQRTGNTESEAPARAALGDLWLESGNLDAAMAELLKSLDLLRTAKDTTSEARVLQSLARAQIRKQDLPGALRNLEASLELIESTRSRLSEEKLRVWFLSSRTEIYELYIDTLLKADGEPGAKAFEASERARARGLLDVITDASAPGEMDSSLSRVRLLAAEVRARDRYRLELVQRGADSGELAAAAADYEQALSQLEADVRSRLRAQDPAFLAQGAVMSLTDLQEQLGPGNSTALLEYFLGEKQSYLWIVRHDSIQLYTLPSRGKLEELVQEVGERIQDSAELLGRKAFEHSSRRLAEVLLGPLQKLSGIERLVIVPHGCLHLVPFGLLPSPASAPGTYQPLAVRFELAYLPSASLLGPLRRPRAQGSQGRKTLAIVADPVVTRADPRLRSPIPSGGSSRPGLSRAIDALGDDKLERLPFSGREAREIARLLPAKSRLLAMGFAASRSLFTAERLSAYRILHFATHGLLNTHYPELSGLVLSLYDENGREQDGFMPVSRIYNLDLPADLVVLSACRTALGKDVKGEGLIGLTRAFFYAGAAGVVSSLWKVDDRATAELMKRFYRKLLKEKLPPAAALREAQLSMWRDPAWQAPYYWAGFIFQGDWQRRPLGR